MLHAQPSLRTLENACCQNCIYLDIEYEEHTKFEDISKVITTTIEHRFLWWRWEEEVHGIEPQRIAFTVHEFHAYCCFNPEFVHLSKERTLLPCQYHIWSDNNWENV